MNAMICANVILIGPLSAGKSTQAALLSAELGLPLVDVDELRIPFYKSIGYDETYADRLFEESGPKARGDYRKPFEIAHVERLLSDHPSGHVIPFGAGNSVYADPVHRARVRRALAPEPNVVLLLPSPNPDESLEVLTQRFRAIVPDVTERNLAQVIDLNRTFLQDPSNAELATATVYTAGRTPDATAREILSHLTRTSSPGS